MAELPGNLAAMLAAAVDARKNGNRKGELLWLDEAMKIAPRDPRTLNAHGMSALADGAIDRAIEYFAAAAAEDPAEPALWMNLATGYRRSGNSDGERASLERVLNIDRRHFMGQLRFAELNERLGLATEAAQGWSNVVQMAAAIENKSAAVADALARGLAFLSRHNLAISAQIDALLGNRLSDIGKGAKRFQACIDHSLGRRTIYANQCAGVYFPFLPADEFFDESHFTWFTDFEKNTDVIAREAVALLNNSSDLIRPYVRMPSGSPNTKWSSLDGSLKWGACFLWEYGVRNDSVCDVCPVTAAALAAVPQPNIPGKAPSAFFSVLQPGARIPPHTGVTNTRAIVHLPLVIPNDCGFRVGGETRQWITGRAFAFDDTIEHEAWNNSSEARIILIFEVWNPHLTHEERNLLTDFYAITEGQIATL